MNYFTYRTSLYKLNRKKEITDKFYSKRFNEAKKSGNKEKMDDVGAEASYELSYISDEISYLMTTYLRNKAEKLLLPFPTIGGKNELWEESPFTGEWHLTNKGISEVRKLIRQERKERLEIITPWIAIIFGMLGALTGLIALIKK